MNLKRAEDVQRITCFKGAGGVAKEDFGFSILRLSRWRNFLCTVPQSGVNLRQRYPKDATDLTLQPKASPLEISRIMQKKGKK
jgi:hypothetical protein